MIQMLTKTEIEYLLEEARKEYAKKETQHNKEYKKEKQEQLKIELIRLDERIEVYKELLNKI